MRISFEVPTVRPNTGKCCLPRLRNMSTSNVRIVFTCRVRVLFAFRCKCGFIVCVGGNSVHICIGTRQGGGALLASHFRKCKQSLSKAGQNLKQLTELFLVISRNNEFTSSSIIKCKFNPSWINRDTFSLLSNFVLPSIRTEPKTGCVFVGVWRVTYLRVCSWPVLIILRNSPPRRFHCGSFTGQRQKNKKLANVNGKL